MPQLDNTPNHHVCSVTLTLTLPPMVLQEQFSDPGIALARQDAQRWEQEVLARAAARAGARVPRPTLRKPAMRTTASRYDNLFNNL